MKAFETNERYAGKVRECCNYAARTAKTYAMGKNNSKRQACGADEKILATNLKADLSGFADKVVEETFTADQAAYILSNLLIFIFMLLSAAAGICACIFTEYTFFILLGAIVLSILSLLAYFGVFGGTSKNVAGLNVLAVLDAAEEVKNRIIVEANLDAPFKRTIKPKTAIKLKIVTFVGIILYFAFDIVSLLINRGQLEFFASEVIIYISFPLALFAFIPLVLSRSVNANASFPGVVDNLVGCYTAAGAMRYLSEMDLRLKNTEFCVLLTGAKNANKTGAKTYCKLHGEQDKAVNTLVVSIDTIYNPDKITVLSNGKKATDTLAAAASVAEVKILGTTPKYIKKNGSMKVFKKNGYSCATITSLEDIIPGYFGTAKDNEENINIKAIENTMKLVLEAAYELDGE